MDDSVGRGTEQGEQAGLVPDVAGDQVETFVALEAASTLVFYLGGVGRVEVVDRHDLMPTAK